MIDFNPYLEQLSRVAAQVLTPEVLLSTGVLTAIAGFAARIAWAAGTATVAWLHSWRLRSVQRHNVALARKQLPFDHGLLAPRCLIVRYGTDLYIEHLASDQERHDGRLQNRILKVPITLHPDGSTSFRLRIPVHRRLGTQFKCFVDVRDNSRTSDVLEFLSDCQSVVSADRSSSPLHPDRIYFLLRTFPTVKAIDGFENNMCFPE